MVQYLNTNQGFVMAVLTAVYVVATIVLVLLAQRQANLTRKSLEMAEKAEKAKYRPYVLFDIIIEDIIAYATVTNSGISPALDVRISVAPKLHWKDKDGVGFVEKGISFLAPTRKISEPFSGSIDFLTQYPELIFKGSVQYKDNEGNNYNETFFIDLSYIRNMSYIGKIDTGKELERIRIALEKFHSSSFNPLIRTIPETDHQEEQKKWREETRKRYAAHTPASKPTEPETNPDNPPAPPAH